MFEATHLPRRTVTRREMALLAVTALPTAACGSGAANRPASPGSSTLANPTLAPNVEWLKRNAAGIRLVDARSAADYDKGHLPGAISLPVTETFDPAKDKNYPDAVEKLEALFGRKGIGAATRVVLYDNGRETAATRLYWTLEYLGHQNAAVLDGGVAAWQAAGEILAIAALTADPLRFSASVQPSRMHAKADCERMLGSSSVVMLDSRSPEEWRGDDIRAKFGGRIPGAVNVDWREHFTPDGLLKPPEALRQLYTAKGVTPDKEVVAYCQTGQRSSVAYWVLRLLGYPKVANYAGSWVEWGNDPGTPKAQGA